MGVNARKGPAVMYQGSEQGGVPPGRLLLITVSREKAQSNVGRGFLDVEWWSEGVKRALWERWDIIGGQKMGKMKRIKNDSNTVNGHDRELANLRGTV